jgi:hypothetical protein
MKIAHKIKRRFKTFGNALKKAWKLAKGEVKSKKCWYASFDFLQEVKVSASGKAKLFKAGQTIDRTNNAYNTQWFWLPISVIESVGEYTISFKDSVNSYFLKKTDIWNSCSSAIRG